MKPRAKAALTIMALVAWVGSLTALFFALDWKLGLLWLSLVATLWGTLACLEVIREVKPRRKRPARKGAEAQRGKEVIPGKPSPLRAVVPPRIVEPEDEEIDVKKPLSGKSW